MVVWEQSPALKPAALRTNVFFNYIFKHFILRGSTSRATDEAKAIRPAHRPQILCVY